MTIENNETGKTNFIIVSNRLPIVIKKMDDGTIEVGKGAGGLVTAMAPVLKNRNGTWVGWPGYLEEEDAEGSMLPAIHAADCGYSVKPVMLNARELNNYYEGFSNSILWPLFHGFVDKCVFMPEYWETYLSVNRKFARTLFRNSDDSDFIWVHDYQMIMVGSELRKMHKKNRMGFFLHIPFPPIDTFIKCPWRFELLSAMLEYDVLGLHTIQNKRNFIECIKKLVKEAEVDVKAAFDETVSEVTVGSRKIRIGVFPISIDYYEFSLKSWDHEVYRKSNAIRENSRDTKILLGVDRLDYTKGIPEKLKAFKQFLLRFPGYHKKIRLIQLLVPSRKEIAAYADLKLHIEQLVGEINGMFSTSDWLPVQYMFRSIDRKDLIALYRASDIAFITPLKDGMNLVAKEYCACNIHEKGVVILSEFTGATQQFYQDAILANPYDIDGMARAIYRACNMPMEERVQRMRNLRENVKNKNVFWWVNSFLQAAIEKDLSNFRQADEYFPDKPDREFIETVLS